MRNTLFALVFPLALVAIDVSPADAQTPPPTQQQGTLNRAHPYGTLGFTSDVDIAFAFMLISIELNENTTLTTDQIDALQNLQQILFNAYFALFFGSESAFQTQIRNALAIFLNTDLGLIDGNEVTTAINNGTFIFGSHPNSNNRVWLALWLTAWAFFDDRGNNTTTTVTTTTTR